MPGSWPHLAARLVDVLSARPLDPAERRWVLARLSPGEQALFFAQPVMDQRHGWAAASVVASGDARPELARLDLIRAALLHDVGKRHARLATLGRVAASLALRVHLNGGGRWGAYRRHGELGAAELAELGGDGVVVAFARHHHSARPPEFDPRDWAVLVAADRARIRRSGTGPGYSRDARP